MKCAHAGYRAMTANVSGPLDDHWITKGWCDDCQQPMQETVLANGEAEYDRLTNDAFVSIYREYHAI